MPQAVKTPDHPGFKLSIMSRFEVAEDRDGGRVDVLA